MNLQCSIPKKSSSILSSFVSRGCRDPESTHILSRISSSDRHTSPTRCIAPLLDAGLGQCSPDRVRERICNTGDIDTEGIRVCAETQHQDGQYDLSCLAPPEGRTTEFDISSEEVVRRPVSARCPDTPNALQGKVAGPTARRDAEEALRSKWVETLASLMRGTPTPMGDLLNKGADNLKLLGRGRRATTLRARGRTVKKYIAWLTLVHEVLHHCRQ